MRAKKVALFLILILFAAETHAAIRASVTSSLSKISSRLSAVGKNVQARVTKITDYLNSDEGDELVDTVSSSIETMGGAVEGLTSSDVTTIVGSSMEILSAVTTLIPVGGPLVSAVFGLIGSIFGALGGEEDTGSIVGKVIEKALNNYDDSELRAETEGTMRVYRISQAFLNSVEGIKLNEHEVSALASHIPVHSGVRFLGYLVQKIKENTEKHDKTQVLRAAEYTQLYVTLAVMRSSILWEMYSILREATHSESIAAGVKAVAESEQHHDKDFLHFLTMPVYSKAIFFSYFNITEWQVTKMYMSKFGLNFAPQYLNSQTHMVYVEDSKNYYITFRAGDCETSPDLTANSKFYFDLISAENNIYYIRSVRFPDEYIIMHGFARIHRHSKPGNNGEFKLIRFGDGKYLMATLEHPEYFLCTFPTSGWIAQAGGIGVLCRWRITADTEFLIFELFRVLG